MKWRMEGRHPTVATESPSARMMMRSKTGSANKQFKQRQDSADRQGGGCVRARAPWIALVYFSLLLSLKCMNAAHWRLFLYTDSGLLNSMLHVQVLVQNTVHCEVQVCLF